MPSHHLEPIDFKSPAWYIIRAYATNFYAFSLLIKTCCSKSSACSILRETLKCVEFCQAKPETVQKVCEIVRKQLALTADTELTPDSTFASLGADSLDTVVTHLVCFHF